MRGHRLEAHDERAALEDAQADTSMHVRALSPVSRAPRNDVPQAATTSPSRSRAATSTGTCPKAASSALGSIIRNGATLARLVQVYANGLG